MVRLSKSLLAATLIACSASSVAQKPWEKFWVARDVRQGMDEAEFNKFVVDNGLKVTNPFPGGETKGIEIDGRNYFLLFCDNKLTYASWLLNDNDELIRSMNERVNSQGFRMTDYKISSEYIDTIKKESNSFVMKFDHPEKAYSVTYNLYGKNGQVEIEDTAYDDNLGCDREGS